MNEGWKLIGHDTFEGVDYPLDGEYTDEEAARQAGETKFQSIEETQPRKSSGGQDDLGIQDRLFIQRPDGTRYRFLPLPPELKSDPNS